MLRSILMTLTSLFIFSAVATANDQLVFVKDMRIIDGSKLTLRVTAESNDRYAATLTTAWFNHANGQQTVETITLGEGLSCNLSNAGKLLTCDCHDCSQEGLPFKLTVEEVGSRQPTYTARTTTWVKDSVTGTLRERDSTIARGMLLLDQ